MTTSRKPKVPVDATAYIENLLGGPITLGALVEAIRRGEEMGQLEFAEKLGVSKSHLSDIERGRKVVSPERAARFAALLGYSPDQFVRLALQDLLRRAGLPYEVDVHMAAP
ncbi:MAG: helix-turn-helix domain-containing protein [Myxococcales bacterium]